MIEVRYRKVFVGGIDPSLSESDLERYFEKFGALNSCTIHRNRDTGRSRGFGFITFKETSSVELVQRSRPHTIEGCEVTTKRAVPRELFQVFDGLLTVTKIFVGGLRQEVEERDLREYFGSFGSVRKVDIMVDRNTNARRGFGFVEFDDYDPVDKAVLQGSHVLQGQDVTVRKAKSRLEMELIRHHKPQTLPSHMRRRSYPPFEEPRLLFDSASGDYARSSFDSFEFAPFHHHHPLATGRGRFIWE